MLKIAPLSVSGLLRTALFDRGRVAMTSATLTVGGGFDALLTALGLDDTEAQTVDVGSPFDHARQGILYVARDVPPPGRDGVAMEALDELADLIEAAGGRTLALFSSWRGVERAAEYLRVRLGDRPELPLLVQRRGDAVGGLVERFAAEPASTLLGTVSLWQGVDVPGESCILVVIDRIPFPRPDDPLVSARQQAVDDQGGSGFRSVSVPRAGLLLAQGAGRLIRGTEDRGVVAVLDSRLATAGYSRALRSSLPPFWYTTDRATVVGSLERLRDELSG
jgi:ATP-dependent DNA helicase DinG